MVYMRLLDPITLVVRLESVRAIDSEFILGAVLLL
jgi:hypothetical protein